MAHVSDVLAAVDRIAPFRMAFGEDRVGLQVGSLDWPVTEGVVSLDCSIEAIEYAESAGAQIIVSHHPLVWDPITRLDDGSYASRRALKLARLGISHIAAHTNWDAAPDGLNDHLAGLLGLSEVRPFGRSALQRSIKLVTFVPTEAADRVVDALSNAGAGEIGLYRRCWFGSSGVGSYIPMEGSKPAIGTQGRIESVEEMRVEMVLPEELTQAAVAALRSAHPYEEPAYDLVRLAETPIQPIGRIGRLPEPRRLSELATEVAKRLECATRAWGDALHSITSVAVVGGSGDDHWQMAQASGADLLVTGEVRHHNALEASESGMAVIEAGHYATENPGCTRLIERLRVEVPDVAWRLFVPKLGSAARPLGDHR